MLSLTPRLHKTHTGKLMECRKSLFSCTFSNCRAGKMHNEQRNCGCTFLMVPCSGVACQPQALQVLDWTVWMDNENRHKYRQKPHNFKVKCVSKEASEVQVHFLHSWIKVFLFRSSDSSLCSSLFKDQSWQWGNKQVLVQLFGCTAQAV